jgi:hypothetical protein
VNDTTTNPDSEADAGLDRDADPDAGSTSNSELEAGPDPSLIVTERSTPKGLLVSVCDEDVLGETFEHGPASLTVTDDFYGGETVPDDEAIDSLARASVANIVGSRAVSLAIEHGFVDEGNVLDLGETHHAQTLRFG